MRDSLLELDELGPRHIANEKKVNPENSKKNQKPILVTGATGYVGGRLVPRLLESGYQVRCLVRDKSRFRGHEWQNQVEVVEADVLDPATLPPALENVSTAYYLIHGVQGGKVDPERDKTAARNFIEAAENANVERIIYLGELADPDEKLSPYLRSRLETGDILRSGSIPTTEFRSGMIVGSGSALFEMVRYLAEREPVMICPRWFYTLAQPISIRNALDYLVAALDVPESLGKVIEIGGPTRLRYADMLERIRRGARFKTFPDPCPSLYAAPFSLLGASGHADSLASGAAPDSRA